MFSSTDFGSSRARTAKKSDMVLQQDLNALLGLDDAGDDILHNTGALPVYSSTAQSGIVVVSGPGPTSFAGALSSVSRAQTALMSHNLALETKSSFMPSFGAPVSRFGPPTLDGQTGMWGGLPEPTAAHIEPRIAQRAVASVSQSVLAAMQADASAARVEAERLSLQLLTARSVTRGVLGQMKAAIVERIRSRDFALVEAAAALSHAAKRHDDLRSDAIRLQHVAGNAAVDTDGLLRALNATPALAATSETAGTATALPVDIANLELVLQRARTSALSSAHARLASECGAWRRVRHEITALSQAITEAASSPKAAQMSTLAGWADGLNAVVKLAEETAAVDLAALEAEEAATAMQAAQRAQAAAAAKAVNNDHLAELSHGEGAIVSGSVITAVTNVEADEIEAQAATAIAAVEADAETLRRRVQALLDELSTASKRTADAEARAASAHVLVAEAQAAASRSSRANEQATASAASQGVAAQVKALETQLQEARAKADQHASAAQATLTAAEERSHQLTLTVARLESQLADATKAASVTQTELADATAAVSVAQAELQSLRAVAAGSSEESQAAAAAAGRAESDLVELRAALVGARQSAATAAAEAEAVLTRVRSDGEAALATSLVDAQQARQQAAAAVAAAEAKLAASRSETDAERQAAAARAAEVHTAAAAASTAAASAAREREEKIKSTAIAQFETLKNRAAAEMEAQRAVAEADISALRDQLAAAHAASARATASLTTLQSDAARLAAEHRGLKAEARRAAAEVPGIVGAATAGITSRLAATAQALASLQERYGAELAERRRLHNLVQELRGNIRVLCRVRPALRHETESGDYAMAAGFPQDGQVGLINNKRQRKTWEFDAVFPPAASNAGVYDQVDPLVVSALDGYHVCIFAYGQTGSGKTYTMEGPPGGAQAERGVNYRALESLFDKRDSRQGFSYGLSVSMLEIYNEGIYDLLAGLQEAGPAQGGPPPGTKLSVREGPQGNYVADQVSSPVSCLEDVLRVMKAGYRNRTTFATAMNDRSSRSHCMVTVNVVGTAPATAAGSGGKPVTYRGRLHLVDLAGSERVSRSGATGDRLKEAQAINKSLSALGDVIAARAEKRSHVPFRNSALTWLLADSLSGDAKTLMIVNVSPVLANAEESFCSLNFAARVNAVELGRAGKHTGGPAAASALPAPGVGAGEGDEVEDSDGGGDGDAASEAGGSVANDALQETRRGSGATSTGHGAAPSRSPTARAMASVQLRRAISGSSSGVSGLGTTAKPQASSKR